MSYVGSLRRASTPGCRDGQHRINYALCGGLALAIYDCPRTTVDIELLILADKVNELIEVARGVGYTVRGLDMSFANDAVEIRRVSQIDPETGFVLSLNMLPQIQQVWDSRVQANWEGGKLSVVSREGLIALKKLGGRPAGSSRH